MLMRIVIKTTNHNPIPEIIFSGTNDDFKKDMFMKINQYAFYGYKVSWQTEGLTLTRGDCIIYMRIINHHQGGKRKGVSAKSYVTKM